jgi:hypothetical protein
MYVFLPHLLIFAHYSLKAKGNLRFLSGPGDIMNPDTFCLN